MKKIIILAISLSVLTFVNAENNLQETLSNEHHKACIPPGVDTVIKPAEQEDDGPIDEQPKLGCAVILCLAAPGNVSECNPVMRALYGRKWLGRPHHPRFPKCNSENISTEVKEKELIRKFPDDNQCVFTAKRKKVDIYDLTLVNFKKKYGATTPNEEGELFFSGMLPYEYHIKFMGKRKDKGFCPEATWGAQDYRDKIDTEEDEAEVRAKLDNLSDLPLCEKEIICISPDDDKAIEANQLLAKEEQRPICTASCVEGHDAEAIAKNNALPKEERLPICGDCQVNKAFLEKIIDQKVAWLSASNIKPYPNIYKAGADNLISEMNRAMSKHGIVSCIEKAHFITQTYFESDRYKTLKEYKPYKGKYQGGQKFHGRGIIQLTHDYNYRKYGKKFGQNPELLLSQLSYGTDSAGYYWRHLGAYRKKDGAKGDINKHIAARPFDSRTVTKAVHGGGSPIDEQQKREKIFLKIVKEWGLKNDNK